jgi:glucokinase
MLLAMAKARSSSQRPFIGIDLGGTNIQIGVVDSSNKVIGESRKKTVADEGIDAVLERLVTGAQRACEDAGITLADCAGLGIGAPSPVDPSTGTVIHAVNLRWNDVPLADILSTRLKLPVYVGNDVDVAVYGEWRCGAGKGVEDLLGIWLGTGVGGGLILSGKLYTGHFHSGGEIGHITLIPNAAYGSRSLEQNCSRTSVVRRLEFLIRANHPSMLTEMTKGDLSQIRSKTIAKAYEAGDKLTHAVIDDVAHLVGVAAASVVTLLSLPRVVIGGGLTEALGEPFVARVRHSCRAAVFPPSVRAVDVVASRLEDNAGVVGSAILARERLG